MIYCPQCGNPNFDDANYCDTCGEPLINADEYAKMRNAAEMQQLLEAQRQQREAAAYNKAYRKAQKEAKKAAKEQGRGAAPVRGSDSNGVPNAGHGTGVAGAAAAGAAAGVASVPGDFTVYKHGCLAQAWDDITESEGWAKRIIALGLINMVPVLNFFVSGFAMKWARQLPLDKVDGMPTKVLQDGSFLQGFYAWLIGLIVGIVAGVVSAILGFVPVLGLLIGVAVSLFLGMFQQLSIMRVAIAGNLAPGFDIKAIWKAICTNRFGKLFCATVLPGLIVGAAALFVCGSVLVVFGMNSLGSLIENIQYAQQMEQQIQQMNAMMQQNPMLGMFADPMMGMYSDPWANVISQAMGLVPLFFILYLILMFLSALSIVLTMRATAHYVTRYEHDWSLLVMSPARRQAQAAQVAQQGMKAGQVAQQQAQADRSQPQSAIPTAQPPQSAPSQPDDSPAPQGNDSTPPAGS